MPAAVVLEFFSKDFTVALGTLSPPLSLSLPTRGEGTVWRAPSQLTQGA